MSSMLDAVDLFAGPGGWDVAAQRLGMKIMGIEWDRRTCLTRRAAGLPTVEEDVRSYSPHDFPARGVIGSPPCQTFSMNSKGSGRKELDKVLSGIEALKRRDAVALEFTDERTSLILEPLRWALEAYDGGTPYEWVALEQVPSVWPVWVAMADALTDVGYFAEVRMLDAVDYGVAQNRRRAILTASLNGVPPMPAKSPTRINIRDVLPWSADTEMRGTRGLGRIERHGPRPGRYADQPSFTITSTTRSWTVHEGAEVRGMTVEEGSLLQSFPAGFPWFGSRSYAFKQVGNAIPPLMAEAVLRSVTEL